LRIRRIKWHISPSCFENGKLCYYQFQRTFQTHPNEDIWSNPSLQQMVSQLVGLSIEITIGEVLLFKD
jgi:hypothetical protein